MHNTQKLEMLMLNAWPSLQTRFVDGWLLRSALGHTKRGNAATPLFDQPIDFEVFEQITRDHYRHLRLPTIFRITPLVQEGFDQVLAQKGYRYFDPTYGMILDIPQKITLAKTESTILTLEESPSSAWIEGAGKAYGFADWQIDALGLIVAQITLPATYCTVYLDKKPVGYGLAVFEASHVGLYDLAINEAHRGRGLGKRMIMSLVHWGRSKGAKTAYLQVRQENEKAFGLYQTLGFKTAYQYHHRIKD